MHFAGLEPAIPAIQWLQPTYPQTARPATSITSMIQLLNGLKGDVTSSSRVMEVRVKSKNFLVYAYAGSKSIAPSSTHTYPRYCVHVSCQLHAPAALLCTHSTAVWVGPEPVWTFWETKICCFWRHSNPALTALPTLPLRDRVYHSPSSCIATDRSHTALQVDMCLPNDY
jgi:hypothetical protein